MNEQKNNNNNKIKMILVGLILVIAIIIFISLTFIITGNNKTIEKNKYCGDSICSISEQINKNCPEDCMNNPSNIDYDKQKEYCGDSDCSMEERVKRNCAQDCGESGTFPFNLTELSSRKNAS